jgi:putative MATE family efflux protein
MVNMEKNRFNKSVLDTDRIGHLFIKLSTPVFFGMFVQSLYNVISAIFVGKHVGPLGIAALSIAFPLQMMGYGLGTMSGIGGMSLISRFMGAGDNEKAEKSLGNGITLAIILSCLAIIGLMPFLNFWLTIMGASEHVLPYAREYMVYIIISMVFTIISTSLLNFTRAEGNAKVSMVSMIAGAIIDIIFCYIFIIRMRMGVKGAGIATIIAQFFSMLYLLNYYRSGKNYLKIRIANFIPDIKIIKEMTAIGFGAFIQMFASSLAAMVLFKMAVIYGGDYALSAFGIAQRILMFITMPGMVISQGIQPILGFNYGAKRFRFVIRSMNMALGWSLVFGTAGFLLVYFTPEPFIRIFTDDPDLIKLSVSTNRYMFMALPILGPLHIGTMIFQAIGKARQAFIAAFGRPVIFLIPSALLWTHLYRLKGVWLAFPSSDVLTLFLVSILMLPILHEFRKGITQNEISSSK